jgi:hypothetical protein
MAANKPAEPVQLQLRQPDAAAGPTTGARHRTQARLFGNQFGNQFGTWFRAMSTGAMAWSPGVMHGAIADKPRRSGLHLRLLSGGLYDQRNQAG